MFRGTAREPQSTRMPKMYSGVLVVHSWLRWAVLLVGLWAFGRAIAGSTAARPWLRADDRAGFWFARLLDVQMLLGLLLYLALSPFTREALADFGAAMSNAGLRYWAVEHVLGMVVGITLAHVGRARVRKAIDARRKHKLTAIFLGLALLAIVVSIPWPGMPNGRPLIRW
jgi:hypothetical protein